MLFERGFDVVQEGIGDVAQALDRHRQTGYLAGRFEQRQRGHRIARLQVRWCGNPEACGCDATSRGGVQQGGDKRGRPLVVRVLQLELGQAVAQRSVQRTPHDRRDVMGHWSDIGTERDHRLDACRARVIDDGRRQLGPAEVRLRT